jgi:hypothetical protein
MGNLKQNYSWGFKAPDTISSLFVNSNEVPQNAELMVSSLGFLRADVDNVFIADHDFLGSRREEFLQTVVPSMEAMRRMSLRIYATARGLRSIGGRLVCSPRIHSALLYEADCDEQYVTVSIETNRYSCRLTPKPARLGFQWGPSQYLRCRDEGANGDARQFFTNYAHAARNFGVCSYVSGPMPTEEPLATFIRFHDSVTRAHEPLPLA